MNIIQYWQQPKSKTRHGNKLFEKIPHIGHTQIHCQVKKMPVSKFVINTSLKLVNLYTVSYFYTKYNLKDLVLLWITWILSEPVDSSQCSIIIYVSHKDLNKLDNVDSSNSWLPWEAMVSKKESWNTSSDNQPETGSVT